MSSSSSSTIRWLPLEANPDVINKYVRNLGIDLSRYEFVDIYGLDDELLQMVPRPVLAILLLFPINESYKKYVSKLEEQAQVINSNVFYTRQTVQNACGTIALIHALANNKEILSIDPSKAFGQYLSSTSSLAPMERAKYLETDTAFSAVHEESAQQGQTDTPNIDEDVDLHFITFIQKDGEIYELDGAKKQPISHGKLGNRDLLEGTRDIVRKLMELTPDEVRFTLIGLTARPVD